MPQHIRSEAYSLAGRSSSDSNNVDLDGANFESQGLTTPSYVQRRRTSSSFSLIKSLPFVFIRRSRYQTRGLPRPWRYSKSRRGCYARRLFFLVQCLAAVLFALILITAVFAPSYTKPPSHYNAMRRTILTSKDYGRGNLESEKIFIAASIYDKGGHLVNGAWGQALLDLVELLGNRNVFLSIYENDAGQPAKEALLKLKDRVHCPNELIFERHVSLKTIPSVVLPDGSEGTKRIAYLANMRNRALRPLDKPSGVKYDKLLFLNDVIFDPIEVVQLLFSTNANENGESSYVAACAVDFINPFKFYDTFATRDAEGYGMGVPFFPWFSSAGKGISRRDVLQGKDAVRVKSCWGGIVAFDAAFFQATSSADESHSNNTQLDLTDSILPIRFRAESDLYWEASECCLVHADLQRTSHLGLDDEDVGIYINPYVRVAYGTRTMWLLRFTRRIEKLYTVPHSIINYLARMPRYNPRRTETGSKHFKERIWVSDKGLVTGGSFQQVSRVAESGGFCGFRTLQLIKNTVRKGEKSWETMPVPLEQ